MEGLEAGVDDYVTKPFRPEVLKARIIALLRRARRTRLKEGVDEGDEIKMGPLRVSLKSYKAYLEGERLSLTPSEIKLLITMLKFRGRVLTRDRLIEEVQGEGISVVGRTVDTHVFGLRKKFGIHSEIIETVRGVGYRVRDDVSKNIKSIGWKSFGWLFGFYVLSLLLTGAVVHIHFRQKAENFFRNF